MTIYDPIIFANYVSTDINFLKVAIEGCCHGELEKIYETLMEAQKKHEITIDLLICCGDFEVIIAEIL